MEGSEKGRREERDGKKMVLITTTVTRHGNTCMRVFYPIDSPSKKNSGSIHTI